MMTKKNKQLMQRTLMTAGAGLHVRENAEGGQSRTITGYAILFNTPSEVLYSDRTEEWREIISPEAVTREVLDNSDIKFTMFHDRRLILARSNKGKGTLSYQVDEKGVSFEFDAPETIDGDKALELVKRGDIAGCSFMFSTYYFDPEYVEESCETVDGVCKRTFTVKKVTGIYDMTLAADPAYSDTSCETRELVTLVHQHESEKKKLSEKAREQVRGMRRAASAGICIK